MCNDSTIFIQGIMDLLVNNTFDFAYCLKFEIVTCAFGHSTNLLATLGGMWLGFGSHLA
jgi:hypothetical protein